jgi:cobalt transporter subunit CbtA
MPMKLLTSAVFAGLAAGLIAALLQFTFVTSSLLEGELYESGAKIHFAVDGTPQSPRGGAEVDLTAEPMRYALTVAFNIVTYTGFGLLLVALMALAETRNLTRITPRQGLIWGLAGFVAIQLAPAVGQPPVLPGSIGAEVGPRQAWWLATLVTAGLAMWLLAFGRGFWPLLAVPLLLGPQLVGAPVLDTYFGVTPAELSASFAAMSLGYAAAAWTALGFFAAYFYTRDSA